MSSHSAEVLWSRGDAVFVDQRYSRRHLLRFDSGVQIAGSSSPQVVPLPYSDAAAVDPEEAFVAALAACHMLWFLSIAAGQGHRVDDYHDQASGRMAPDGQGLLAMVEVVLRPAVRWSGSTVPTAEQIAELHRLAHAQCFLARSVTCVIRIEPAASG